MGIDAYSLCPCHSGNKIKFCCGKDVMHDLDEILNQSGSGQTSAAIDRLNRTIERAGPKECLLVIKAHILLTTDKFEEAEETNKLLLKGSPNHVMGLQQRAMLDVSKGNIQDAVNSLQDAMDQIKGEEIPINVGSAFRMIGSVLYGVGSVPASIAHMRFAAGLLEGEEATEVQRALEGVMQRATSLVKQPFMPPACPEGVEWEKLYSNVGRAIARGQFRRAMQFLAKIDSDFPENETIVEALAIVTSILGREDTAQAWTRLAEMPNLNLARKIEATGLAMMFDQTWDELEDVEEIVYEIKDFDKVVEAMISSSHFSMDALNPQAVADIEGPRPRHIFMLYNEPLHDVDEEHPFSGTTFDLTGCVLYGKQTDREAQMAMEVSAADKEKVCSLLEDLLGDHIGEAACEKVRDEAAEERLMTRHVRFPKGVTDEQAQQAFEDGMKSRFTDEWVHLKVGKDKGTIADAIKDPELQHIAYARFLMIAAELPDLGSRERFLEMAELLGLPKLDPVDAKSPRALSSPFFLKLVDLKSLSLEELSQGLNHSVASRMFPSASDFANAILARDDRDRNEDFGLFMLLAKAEIDRDKLMGHLDKALEVADSQTMQVPLCRVERMRYMIEFGQLAGAQDELKNLAPYLSNPQIQYAVTSVLASYGLLSPDQPLESMVPKVEEPVSPIIGVGDSAAADTGESKLWLPD